MKKLILLSFLTAILFSCAKEKDYTCQCTYSHNIDTNTIIKHETFPMRSKSSDQTMRYCTSLKDKYISFSTTGDCYLIP